MKRLRSAITVLSLFITAAVVPMTFTSCERSGDNKPVQKVSRRVQDKEAYALGEQHARELLRHVANEDSVQEGLLDIRSRMSNIESSISRQSAVDYERGFTDYVRKNCDSLARIIF